jgi:aspartyl-tRNA(Asn)/glutamyl-tRNA(Gln) amidotransferase subunit B
VKQETRGWDDAKQKTFSQRTKENSEDYRYFPDPDLPKLKLSELDELSDKTLRATLPELPWEKRERLASQYGIKDEDVEMYVRDERYGHLFDIVAKSLKEHVATVRLASNYITSDIAGQVEKGEKGVEEYIFLNEKVDDFAKSFAKLMHMVEKGDVSSRGAKDVLAIMLEKGGDPETIAKKEGLVQKSDEGEMRTLAEGIIAEHEDVANEYKAGKESALQFLIGQGMKATKGSANPQILKKLFETLLQ